MNESEILRLAKQIVKNIPVGAIKDGKLDEKFVEIVVRRSDGKISSMAKCVLDNGGEQKILSKVLQNVPVGAISGVGTVSSLANNVQTEMVRREVKKVGKDVKEVLELTKNMSANVDKIAQGMSVVQSLSILNVALSVANMGVSVAGFAIVNKKLNAVNEKLGEIYKIVSNIQDMEIIKIMNEGKEIIAKTNGLYQHIDFGDAEIKQYEDILGKYREYIQYLRDYVVCGHIDYDRGYGMIMELFPTYIDILKKYVIEVRYAKGEFPRLEYNTHISVILSLTNQEFLEKLFDFAYLDHDISKMDSEIAQGIHLLSIGNAYTEVEDTKNLILAIKEKKDYIDLEKAIAMESQRRLINALPERIDGTEYDRKGVIKEIQKLELV